MCCRDLTPHGTRINLRRTCRLAQIAYYATKPRKESLFREAIDAKRALDTALGLKDLKYPNEPAILAMLREMDTELDRSYTTFINYVANFTFMVRH